jgi:hypothetical protein
MIIVCSWCRKEGKHEIVGEKVPLDDQRETHGICVTHRQLIQTRWKEVVGVSGSSCLQTGRTIVALSALQHWGGLLSLASHVQM